MAERYERCGKGNIVGIAAVLGGIFLVITVLFLIFAKDSLGSLIPIVWALVLLGILLGLFQMLSDRKR